MDGADVERLVVELAARVGDGVVILDGAGRIRFWNEGARAVFGYDADEVVGRPVTATGAPSRSSSASSYSAATRPRPWER